MIRLVESFSAYKNSIQELPLSESTLTEKETGKVYETKKKYRVDISRFTENLNNRIYSKGLWEKVITNQKPIWEGSFALADHPNDEGSFKDVMGVWSNLHINEKTDTVKADVTFVGPYGQKAIEILEAGGRIGFSSSGFGDLKEDGKTVDESTYQIERIADCVLNPSQQVFGTIKDAIEESTNSIYNIKEDTKEHLKMSSNKQSKLEERKFREVIGGYLAGIKEAVNSPDKKLEELTELLSYFDDLSPTDLKEEVEAEVAKTQIAIKEAIQLSSSLKETFGTDSPEAFKEGFSKLAVETALFERQTEDWKKLAETLQVSVTSLKEELTDRPTVEMLEEARTRYLNLKKKYIEKQKTLIAKIHSKNKSLDENVGIYKEVVKEIEGIVKTLTESEKINVELFKANKNLIKENASLITKLEEAQVAHSKRVKELTALPTVKHTDPKTMFKGYTEGSQVGSYYNDLEKQHGKDILPYKEKILNCKTVFEAMRIYNTALIEMTDSIYTYRSGDLSENKKKIEEATNTRITHSRELKRPEGWE